MRQAFGVFSGSSVTPAPLISSIDCIVQILKTVFFNTGIKIVDGLPISLISRFLRGMCVLNGASGILCRLDWMDTAESLG